VPALRERNSAIPGTPCKGYQVLVFASSEFDAGQPNAIMAMGFCHDAKLDPHGDSLRP
jgi:hypothetical protein